MTTNQITVQATVSTDISKAWEYYTDPKHISKWNFATEDWHCPHVSNNMKVGGKYIARMEAKDGSFGFDFEAVYDEIKNGEMFKYTMPDNRQVTANFKRMGNKTEVIITFDAENENSLEMQKSGWQSILNNYKKYTEAN